MPIERCSASAVCNNLVISFEPSGEPCSCKDDYSAGSGLDMFRSIVPFAVAMNASPNGIMKNFMALLAEMNDASEQAIRIRDDIKKIVNTERYAGYLFYSKIPDIEERIKDILELSIREIELLNKGIRIADQVIANAEGLPPGTTDDMKFRRTQFLLRKWESLVKIHSLLSDYASPIFIVVSGNHLASKHSPGLIRNAEYIMAHIDIFRELQRTSGEIKKLKGLAVCSTETIKHVDAFIPVGIDAYNIINTVRALEGAAESALDHSAFRSPNQERNDIPIERAFKSAKFLLAARRLADRAGSELMPGYSDERLKEGIRRTRRILASKLEGRVDNLDPQRLELEGIMKVLDTGLWHEIALEEMAGTLDKHGNRIKEAESRSMGATDGIRKGVAERLNEEFGLVTKVAERAAAISKRLSSSNLREWTGFKFISAKANGLKALVWDLYSNFKEVHKAVDSALKDLSDIEIALRNTGRRGLSKRIAALSEYIYLSRLYDRPVEEGYIKDYEAAKKRLAGAEHIERLQRTRKVIERARAMRRRLK